MVDSSLRLSVSSRTIMPRPVVRRSLSDQRSQFNLGLLIALITFAFAVGFVPERPNELASICQKHHPTIACQVW